MSFVIQLEPITINAAEWRRCDGFIDCSDGYDELNCHQVEEELDVVSHRDT